MCIVFVIVFVFHYTIVTYNTNIIAIYNTHSISTYNVNSVATYNTCTIVNHYTHAIPIQYQCIAHTIVACNTSTSAQYNADAIQIY